MHAKTTIARSKDFKSDRIWLNGKEESISNPRLVNCLREIRKRSGSEDGVHICSENNFPTAAGLASSAAGYACLGKFTKSTAGGLESNRYNILQKVRSNWQIRSWPQKISVV